MAAHIVRAPEIFRPVLDGVRRRIDVCEGTDGVAVEAVGVRVDVWVPVEMEEVLVLAERVGLLEQDKYVSVNVEVHEFGLVPVSPCDGKVTAQDLVVEVDVQTLFQVEIVGVQDAVPTEMDDELDFSVKVGINFSSQLQVR